jgi:thioredoxin reductase (NADPH)
MVEKSCDLMVIGAGPAGLTAALYGQRLGMEVIVFGDVPGGNLYMIERLMNVPGFPGGVPGAQLGAYLFKQAMEEGAFFPMARLERLSRGEEGFFGEDANKRAYAAPAVLLASGRTPTLPDTPNAGKKGVHLCSICDGPLYRGKQAILAVIGCGGMAAHHVLTLSKVAERVLLICEGEGLEMEASLRKRIGELTNVKVLLNVQVIAFTGADAIDGVVLSSPEGEMRIPIDGVFTAGNWRPNLQMLSFSVEKNPEGYVKTGETFTTSMPGLYAAGDVRDTDIWQVVTSCADGARAATHIFDFLEKKNSLSRSLSGVESSS